MRVANLLVVACALCCVAIACGATPYVPTTDDAVLERLPEKTDPSLKVLKRIRVALASEPGNVDLAAALARRAIEATRSTGDPRFLGMAQAALAPWWNEANPPVEALLLRATIRQSQHDFDGALRDLDALLAAHPQHAQARLTRATILTVQGRYADARRDCAALAGRASPLVLAACDAAPASLSADDEAAYRNLVAHLQVSRDPPDVQAWARTLAGEIAQRRGDDAAAKQQFASALALDPSDAYLNAAFADFLLARGGAEQALPLVGSDLRNDALLLRVALAEQQLPSARDAYVQHRAEIAARFEAARKRGDTLHLREEARFRLWLEHDARDALALARRNWSVQREPADLLVLAQAARAANDAAALALARDWIAATGLRDVAVASILGTP